MSISLVESALVEGPCPPPLHNLRYLVGTAHNDVSCSIPV